MIRCPRCGCTGSPVERITRTYRAVGGYRGDSGTVYKETTLHCKKCGYAEQELKPLEDVK